MMYFTDEGVLINLNYIGAIYKRKSKNENTFDILVIPYDKISSLAILQPHESNPNYKPRESFEILLRQNLSMQDATAEIIKLMTFVNENN